VPTATRRIFISYRRSDTLGYAGWLNQILEEQFGRSNVFRDLDSIAPGEHFPTKLARTIADCTDVFVLIGNGWLGPGAGGSRLGDHDDWVRLELEAAIQHGLRIVPLLIGGARVPPREALPPSLHVLCDRQAFALRDSHFAEDVRHVVNQTAHVSTTDLEYLGTAAARRDDRFVELTRLWDERVQRPQAFHLRPQFDALINLLEPDEPVADVAMGCVFDDAEPENSLRGFLRKVRENTALGVIALAPRRLIHVPRRLPSSPTRVLWYRDVIDVKPRIGNSLLLVLLHLNVTINISGPANASETVLTYIKDRLDPR
jgi:TIR domain